MSALVAVDAMLSDAGLCYAQSYEVVHLAAERFAREFSYTAVNRQALATRFRTLAPALEAAIDAPLDNDRALLQLRAARRACFAACSFDLSPAAIGQEKNDFLRSHLHMACNRLLNSSRKHEAYIYGYLARIYRSRAARGLSRPAPEPAPIE